VWCETAEDDLSDAKQVPNQVLKGTTANQDIAPRALAGISLGRFPLQRFERFLFNEGRIAGGRIQGCITSPGRIKAISRDASSWRQMGVQADKHPCSPFLSCSLPA
jgi:hypothetical protein